MRTSWASPPMRGHQKVRFGGPVASSSASSSRSIQLQRVGLVTLAITGLGLPFKSGEWGCQSEIRKPALTVCGEQHIISFDVIVQHAHLMNHSKSFEE